MIILISPAKTFSKIKKITDRTPVMIRDTKNLVSSLKKLSVQDFKVQMKISESIASNVFKYYQDFNKHLYQAIYTYDGYQYKGINPHTLHEKDITYMDNHLYIVSGLYGLVKPLDGISLYRLEMKDQSITNLCAYWNPRFKKYLKTHHQNDDIIDLMSAEYRKAFKGINRIEVDFYEIVNEQLTSISMHVKMIRGLFSRYIITHRMNHLDDIKSITIDGYTFNPQLSNASHFIYTKEVINHE
ncbi:MAG: YaaA family protein [Bacillota bacterium]|nr:MAG: YaaA family protein [Bacillota bacterium]